MTAWWALAVLASDASLLADLERLDKRLLAAEARVLEATVEQQQVEAEIAGVEAERAGAELRRDEALAALRKRLQALAAMPAGARLVLLGGATSLGDFLWRKRLLRSIAGHDRHLHQRYLNEAEALTAANERLQARRQRTAALTEELRAVRDRVATTHRERLDLLRAALSSRDRAQKVAEERQRAHGTLLSTLKRLSPQGRVEASFSRMRGRLPWPAAGKLGARFGHELELAFGTRTLHRGIDILAPVGTPVQAVAPAQVAFADYLKGYGQVVILDHGEGYHSIAAHLSKLDVQAGARVTAGARLGVVGDTGSLLGTRLYFEIAKDGVPQDPQEWLRR